MPNSITIVIPALNEEAAIGATIDTVLKVLMEARITRFEILVFDDGGTDQTGAIAESYAKKNPAIRVFHNAHPQGMGNSYRKGLEVASCEYYSLIHGDNEIPEAAIRDLFTTDIKTDFLITYIIDDHRAKSRKVLSRYFTGIINTLFGLKVTYYNGPTLIPVRLLKQTQLATNGHAFMAETIVRLIKRGRTFTEIGFRPRVRKDGRTKAFRIKNVISVLKAIVQMRLAIKG